MAKIGIDIIEIERVEKTYLRFKNRFLDRVFTKEEIKYAFGFTDPFPHLAASFAGKEALFKATAKSVPFHRIEIIGRPPEIKIDGEKITGLSVSLSHNRGQAIAVVLWEDTKN